jgi:hypothetical protein
MGSDQPFTRLSGHPTAPSYTFGPYTGDQVPSAVFVSFSLLLTSPLLTSPLLSSPLLSSPLRAISRPPSPPPSIPLSIQPFQKPTRTSTILTQRASPIHFSAKGQGRQQCCRRWQNISRDSPNHQPTLRGVGSQPPRTRLQAPNRVMGTLTALSSTGGDFSRAISRPQHEYIITEDDPSGHVWSHIYRYPTDDREIMESKPHALWLGRHRATPSLGSVLNNEEGCAR